MLSYNILGPSPLAFFKVRECPKHSRISAVPLYMGKGRQRSERPMQGDSATLCFLTKPTSCSNCLRYRAKQEFVGHLENIRKPALYIIKLPKWRFPDCQISFFFPQTCADCRFPKCSFHLRACILAGYSMDMHRK